VIESDANILNETNIR